MPCVTSLVKLPDVQFIDHHEGKAGGIQTSIGPRPIASFAARVVYFSVSTAHLREDMGASRHLRK